MSIIKLLQTESTNKFKILYSLWILWQIVKLPLGVYKLQILNIAFAERENIEYYGLLYIIVYGIQTIVKWVLDIICYPEELIFNKDCYIYLIKECGNKYLDSLLIEFKNNNPYDKVNQTASYINRIIGNLKHMIEFSIGHFFVPIIWLLGEDLELCLTIFAIRLIVNIISFDLIKFIKYLNKRFNSQMIETDTKGRLHTNILTWHNPADIIFENRMEQIEKDRILNLDMDKNIALYWRIFDLTIDIPNIFLTYLLFQILSDRTDMSLTNLLLIFQQSNKVISSMQGLIFIIQRFYVQKASIDDFFESLNKAKNLPKISCKNIDIKNVTNLTISNISIKLKKSKDKKTKKIEVESYVSWKFKKNEKDEIKTSETFESKLTEINLKFGEITSLEGKIGSGKSCFLKALTQYNDTTTLARVVINDKEYMLDDFQTKISYSPQEESFQTYDNISCKEVLSGFSEDKLSDEYKEKLLTEIINGICDKIPFLKKLFGIDGDIEEGMTIKKFLEKEYSSIKPSGGQKGILTIIKHLFVVVAYNKKILILDEVDKAIKDSDAEKVWKYLVEYVKKYKLHMIYVSHHKSTYQFANQRILFKVGEDPIVESKNGDNYDGDDEKKIE